LVFPFWITSDPQTESGNRTCRSRRRFAAGAGRPSHGARRVWALVAAQRHGRATVPFVEPWRAPPAAIWQAEAELEAVRRLQPVAERWSADSYRTRPRAAIYAGTAAGWSSGRRRRGQVRSRAGAGTRRAGKAAPAARRRCRRSI